MICLPGDRCEGISWLAKNSAQVCYSYYAKPQQDNRRLEAMVGDAECETLLDRLR